MSIESEATKFKTLFKQHLNGAKTAQIRYVSCKAVDWDNRIMEATDEDGLEYYHIACGLGAVVMKPAVGSDCVIAIMEDEESVAVLLQADEVEEILFRNGENGGLTITPKLVEELEKTNDLLEALIQVLNGSPVPEPGLGAPSALQTALKAAITGKQLGDYSNIEDKTILH